MLVKVADQLNLFLDHRFRDRPARGDKILWTDEDGNAVDFDFVMELGGDDTTIGVPVAFFECFWRRGSRHSKDKARDDSGKLMPMRDLHATARFIGIVAGGDFTGPAREYVHSRNIDLFYVTKARIVEAFDTVGLTMDYPDKLAEDDKHTIATNFERAFTTKAKKSSASRLRRLIGRTAMNAYALRVRSKLAALPQEIRVIAVRESTPRVFATVDEVTDFLLDPDFTFDDPNASFRYEITYSDGTDFVGEVATQEELRELHESVQKLSEHFRSLAP